jgi:hypothetical protein
MTPQEKEHSEQRTLRQNAALHKYFQLLAERLNDAGLDLRAVLKPSIEIPWTKDSVKEHLWRPVQELCLKKDSTTELTTAEVGRVYEVLNRFLGEKHGVHEPFPSTEQFGELK